ncbi:GNAT family N-acetyltransferase [Knoellia subterranea]|nr:GNAT family N-acetyltransferase [Knoellia subterranea]
MTTTTRPVMIDALARGDTRTVHEVFGQLSPASVWLRFHTGMPRLTASMAARLSEVSPGRHEVFVARVDGRPVGLARWIRLADDPLAVEVAVEVADCVQGQGIGKRLLERVTHEARSAGAREIHAHVHPDNRPVIAWLRRLGAAPPRDAEAPFRLSLTEAVEAHTCGCMGRCGLGCSGPFGPRSTPGSSRPAALGRATSSPSWWRVGGRRWPARPSSTSSGVTRHSA